MCARPRTVGKCLFLLGALLGWTAIGWAAESSARIGTIRFLRDGAVDKICFDYQGTLKYSDQKFPQGKYGVVEFQSAVYPPGKTVAKPRGTFVQDYTIAAVSGDKQAVRLTYRLERWTNPIFRDSGNRMEIHFTPVATSPPPRAAAEAALAGTQVSELAPGATTTTAAPAPADSLFADYMKIHGDSSTPAAPIPARSSVPETAAIDSRLTSSRVQGGEGVPSAEESMTAATTTETTLAATTATMATMAPTPAAAPVAPITAPAPAPIPAPATPVAPITPPAQVSESDILSTRPAPILGPGFMQVVSVSTPTAANGAMPKISILTPTKAYLPSTTGADQSRVTGGRGYEFVDLESEVFRKRISPTFKEADLQNVIRVLARHAGLNIVMDPREVRGTLTVEFNDVPVGAALAAILRTHSLELIREAGGIYRVVPSTRVRRTQIETVMVHIPLNWVNATEVRAILDPIVTGQVSADPVGNSIIVEETPLKIEEIINVIRRLDRPEKQVMLEARLVEMNTNLSRGLGMAWDMTRADRDVANNALNTDPNATPYQTNPFSYSPLSPYMGAAATDSRANPTAVTGQGWDTVGVNARSPVPAVGSWAWGTGVNVGGQSYQLSLLLEAAEATNLAKTLVSPRVATINNQPALIRVQRQIPYTTTIVGSGGATSIIWNYEDVGIDLSITPSITNNDYVRMKIVPKQKILISLGDPGSRPTIDERFSQTNVIVKDEETAIIAGLRSQEFTNSSDRVPWLGQIPCLGWAFKNSGVLNNKTDLLAFVTPHIIKEAQFLTDEEKARYDEIDIKWDLPDKFFDEVGVTVDQ